MGALPHADGTTFRVWAPAATAVALVGPFNDWDATTHPLTHEADGYWAADFADLGPGTEYKFHLTTPTGELTKNDPYAREVTHSAGNSVVHDPNFDWEDDHFQMPAWNELVIYELHVGTFYAPDPDAARHVLRRHREARLPARAGHQRHRNHAGHRVSGQPELGLQPGPPLRHRNRLRRAHGLQGVRQAGPPPRHCRGAGRGVQPLRARRPGPVAV